MIKKLILLIIAIIMLVIFKSVDMNNEWRLFILTTLLMLVISRLVIKTHSLTENLTHITLFWIYRLYIFILVMICILNSEYMLLLASEIDIASRPIFSLLFIALGVMACAFCGVVVVIITWMFSAAILAIILELMGCHYVEPFNDNLLAASMSKVITRFRKNS